MLLRFDYCVYVLVACVAALIIIIAVARKKGKKKTAARLLIAGLLLPFVLVYFRYSVARKFYFIDPSNTITVYLVVGNPVFTYARPLTVRLERSYEVNPGSGQVMVLNLSGSGYHVSRIVYGETSTPWQDVPVPSGSAVVVDVSEINYMPWDSPPMYSTVSHGASSSISYRLSKW